MDAVEVDGVGVAAGIHEVDAQPLAGHAAQAGAGALAHQPAGAAALGSFLVVGFTLHNVTEGIGVVAPLTRQRPPLRAFVLLALLAGGPAILGTWIGGLAFSPLLAALFLSIGAGAILQVIWEVGRLLSRDAQRAGGSALTWLNFAGLAAGILIMYGTAFLVK